MSILSTATKTKTKASRPSPAISPQKFLLHRLFFTYSLRISYIIKCVLVIFTLSSSPCLPSNFILCFQSTESSKGHQGVHGCGASPLEPRHCRATGLQEKTTENPTQTKRVSPRPPAVMSLGWGWAYGPPLYRYCLVAFPDGQPLLLSVVTLLGLATM